MTNQPHNQWRAVFSTAPRPRRNRKNWAAGDAAWAARDAAGDAQTERLLVTYAQLDPNQFAHRP